MLVTSNYFSGQIQACVSMGSYYAPPTRLCWSSSVCVYPGT